MFPLHTPLSLWGSTGRSWAPSNCRRLVLCKQAALTYLSTVASERRVHGKCLKIHKVMLSNHQLSFLTDPAGHGRVGDAGVLREPRPKPHPTLGHSEELIVVTSISTDVHERQSYKERKSDPEENPSSKYFHLSQTFREGHETYL